MLKTPFQKDAAFLADVRRVLASKGRCVWWLGQSGFLVAQKGRALLLDPYLSDSLTRKYERTDRPHVRITERVVDPDALAAIGVIDVITSSHNHTDHLDAETLGPLMAGNPTASLIMPTANLEFAAERLGSTVVPRFHGLDDGASIEVAGLEIHGIASAHNTIELDSSGHCRFLGYVVRWNGLTLYHSGDTLWHEQLVPSLNRFKIDLAFLPINGDQPARKVAGNLDGRQAARLAQAIKAHYVIPCHYDLFEFNTAAPDKFVEECRRLDQPFRVLGNGEGWDIDSH